MRSDTTKKRDKWLNIYDYGNAYIKGTDLYQNPLKATSERNFGMNDIIRNCPAIYEYGKGLCCNDLKFDEHTLCQDCTDCVMKQIVEKCKLFQNNYLVNDGVQLLTTNILNSLDIQEVE